MQNFLLLLSYLIGSISFIVGLKMLSHPDTARKGNLYAAVGMSIAIFATIFLYTDESGQHLGNYLWIFGGLIIGTAIGTMMAKKVQMTAMPQMVSLFNGMGGACAAIISIVEFKHLMHQQSSHDIGGSITQLLSTIIESVTTTPSNPKLTLLTILVGLVIGTVSFFGSMIAFGKLNGNINDKTLPAQQVVNIGLLLVIVGLIVVMLTGTTGLSLPVLFWSLFAISALYGILFVMPIGGADMPVVISLLNSFTGVAAACGGFLYHNPVMLTGGILVGSAGTILTILMCKAMNRSLTNVIVGAFGGNKTGGAATESGGAYKEISMSDTAVLMAYSKRVVIVPGYGLAVAQAQHTCHELEKVLEEKGVELTYAIHPVAGRMPGHMNVLLAEADVPYEKLKEMEEINPEFAQTDVVLILGANDVVNPAAKNDPSSPIYGMPILEVENATHVIVNKRSMKPGYAGIENALFYQPKTSMLFGDAKKVLQDLVSELKGM
ncbi:MAG: NAD(P)(+) transhydrogenase (Re/Si-specific) subunit beta [Bacteroidetes bacterium]|jgi:NAD(P) transhydrogenase subunit beta|nr:NAD(P)(+) transhydrogenase (Re/Si-specific) subunit beta [Bacteroidota bacterium]MBK7040400.1 NAD(P)(+) transhydrogenase (Re/Si-specific) subunit beta [Bacteroidota bacterium]MBK7587261.1 NAD(P)(+) transhydrogenase (Re/Si-specific) subunit beta [Bacteroidota bacterium]MBK8328214.1 NAD(P)(+) transhydrogenase (Re/Si-specific) subunit beta [Bacteroidota bacterium]MBK9300171.1 NAD(P)(+) transhydrogenase (Re/Si-specific) subunit beta [Bacteroidota bacterium]